MHKLIFTLGLSALVASPTFAAQPESVNSPRPVSVSITVTPADVCLADGNAYSLGAVHEGRVCSQVQSLTLVAAQGGSTKAPALYWAPK
ncbi:hypothetical protein [Castellaniella sp. UC4442_H9]